MPFYFYHRSKLSLFQSRVSLQKASVKVSFCFVFFLIFKIGFLCVAALAFLELTLFIDHAGLEISLPLPPGVLAPLCLAKGEYLNSIYTSQMGSLLAFKINN